MVLMLDNQILEKLLVKFKLNNFNFLVYDKLGSVKFTPQTSLSSWKWLNQDSFFEYAFFTS